MDKAKKMMRSTLIKIAICVVSFASVAYAYLEDQNELTKLRILIPKLEMQLIAVQEKNARLCLEIEQFESPANLMQLAKQCEYSHLYHPYEDDILVISMATPNFIFDSIELPTYERFSLESKAIIGSSK